MSLDMPLDMSLDMSVTCPRRDLQVPDGAELVDCSFADGTLAGIVVAPRDSATATATATATAAQPASHLTAVASAVGLLEGHREALATAVKVVSNILSHPSEPKYRRLRLTNAALQQKLLGRTGGEALLLRGLGRDVSMTCPSTHLRHGP